MSWPREPAAGEQWDESLLDGLPTCAVAWPGLVRGVIQGIWAAVGRSVPSDLKDDCYVEALVVLWQAREQLLLLPEEERPAYAVTALRRAVWRRLRAELTYRRHLLPTTDADSVEAVAEAADPRNEALVETIEDPVLARLLLGLAGRQRVILDLFYGAGMTDGEIAARVGQSRGSVKMARVRALLRLRIAMIAEGQKNKS